MRRSWVRMLALDGLIVAGWSRWLGDPPLGAVLASLGLSAVSILTGALPIVTGFARLEHLDT